ncbi:Zinc finger protein 836 [Eumeta japonica]|uniref:Zinc finger protein 836 n=1 Tax=Eumeta variegata TaxID=151549 RepID=A0A4C1YQC8_EUMVA|nr:Zinc finger protein 836 [Eumeta japonica]
MVSSDDEPLAVIAASKKLNPNLFKDYKTNTDERKVRKHRKNKKLKKISLKIRLPNLKKKPPQIIERPMDCSETFESEGDLRKHFSDVHHLVHCRLCFFMMSDNDEYHSHLFQKHNVTNIANRETELLWEMEYDGSPKFICLLCSGSTVLVSDFFKHFVCYHHFTLKCITNMLSGRDLPFSVYGVNISQHFLETQLKDHMRYGYIDPDQKMVKTEIDKTSSQPLQGLEPTDVNPNLLDALIPEIKQENLSDHDDEAEQNKDTENSVQRSAADNIFIENYKGNEDFDVTLIELMLLQKCSFDYINMILESITLNIIPKLSNIDYTAIKSEQVVDVDCPLCLTKYQNMTEFCGHLCKMHGIKSVPAYSCRVCSRSFESDSELANHMGEEMAEFEDLWLCQFCDKEFDDRVKTREHLTEHWTTIDIDNCFSPHLGFKCKYCPTLFWNEAERESHQNRVHMNKHKEDFYKCESCSEIFSDKTMHCQSIKPPDAALTCSVCGREFNNAKACGTHMSLAHGPGRFKCKLCYETLQSSDERKLHYLIRHPGKHPFECNICGKSFQYKSSLYMHRTDHHTANKVVYTCSYCNKEFNKKDSFREHVLIHEGPRHACSYCPMRFVQRSNMLRHERRHTDRQYQDERYMLRHLRTTHSEAGQYACPLCEKCLNSAVALRHHVITHSRRKLFQCLRCSKSYSVKKSILRHLRKRHRIKADQDSVKEFYKKLDARECQLGLDEETITSIFGPPRLRNTDVMIGNFVTFPKETPIATINLKDVKNNDTNEKSDGENESNNDNSDFEDQRASHADAESDNIQQAKNKTKKSDHNSGTEMEGTEEGNELEPTSFVNIKLEPVSMDEEFDN